MNNQQSFPNQPEIITPQPKPNYIKSILFSIIGIILIGVIVFLYLQNQQLKIESKVSNFAECSTIKGALLRESYPAVCVLPSGKSFTQELTDEEKSQLIPPKETNVELLISIPPDETTGWKTYIHKQNFYTFKYPEDQFTLEENPIDSNPNSACKTEVVLANRSLGFIKKSMSQYILLGDISIDVCKVSKEAFPDAAFSNISGDKIRKTKIDNSDAYIKKGVANMFKLNRKDEVERVVTYKDGMQYSFELRFAVDRPDNKPTFDQILSTFRFTNEN